MSSIVSASSGICASVPHVTMRGGGRGENGRKRGKSPRGEDKGHIVN
jgi:hypothetical protein